MRNTIIIVGAVALGAYALGRWNDPEVRKERERQAKQLAKKYKRTTKDLEKKSKKLKKKFS